MRYVRVPVDHGGAHLTLGISPTSAVFAKRSANGFRWPPSSAAPRHGGRSIDVHQQKPGRIGSFQRRHWRTIRKCLTMNVSRTCADRKSSAGGDGRRWRRRQDCPFMSAECCPWGTFRSTSRSRSFAQTVFNGVVARSWLPGGESVLRYVRPYDDHVDAYLAAVARGSHYRGQDRRGILHEALDGRGPRWIQAPDLGAPARES